MKYATKIGLVICLAIPLSIAAQKEAPKYKKVSGGFLMVLTRSDSLFQQLENLAKQENIPSAFFTGMGFVNITFGYFDQTSKQYLPSVYNNVELASLHGSIAWKDGKPSVHAHGVVAGADFKAYAGHILRAAVSTGSLEIMIIVHSAVLQRVKDESLGADVLQLQ